MVHVERRVGTLGLVLIGAILSMFLVWVVGDRAAAQQSTGKVVYGLTTTNRLVSFNQGSPGTLLSNQQITGVKRGEWIAGMDFRPATGQLFAIGSTNQVYRINPDNARATAIGGRFEPGLSGLQFGIDFNPTVDLIRVVSTSGQNLRVSPETGQVVSVDGTLSYANGDENAGDRPSVSGAAYTNSRPGATTTALYDIDSRQDVLATQDANPGILSTVGDLGVDTSSLVGFDIAPRYGALAALKVGNAKSALYSVSLDSGQVTSKGVIGTPTNNIRDIAIPLAVPSDD